MNTRVYLLRLDADGPAKYVASWQRHRKGPLKGQWDINYANGVTNTPRLWTTTAKARRAVDQFSTPEISFTIEAAHVILASELPANLRDEQPTLLEAVA